MKKKWVTLGSAIGISSIVMVTAGMSVMAGTSGYDTYKSALKTTKAAKSVSVQAEAVVQDNGVVLTSANGSFKASLDNKTGSGTVDVTSGGAGQKLSFYKQESGTVLKSADSDVYYVRQDEQDKQDKRKKAKEPIDQAIPQQVETVIDALVGNLKDYVAVDAKADGSKEVSVELTNAQLPAVVNAIAPIAIKNAVKEHHDGGKEEAVDNKGELPFNKDFLGQEPQLSQDIKIDKVSLKAVIDASNYITHQEADLTVSGKDEAGTPHVVTFHVNADLSDYNSTTPDQIDLTGKQVQTIKNDHKWKREN
ncbi:hypothetical protein [Paenibacillus sp. MBLB4367]|uniref:hypothetical protein n=1 Tax=Paenibacillus sp. MBLB4367 TaxID=3384767 RepID=UPI0039082C7A